ncbi:MAG: ferric reductase-like transmembrane domain-containing protein [Acidimicrobiia bacterium]
MNITWFIVRGSGVAAIVLLSASMVWGLWISTKTFGRTVKAKGLQWLHESLGLAALGATIIHMVALSVDEFVEFSWWDITIPGIAEWEPLATSLGVVAFWTMLLVSVSFYAKRWISQNAWRSIHYLSFGAFLAAMAHGVMAGTDSRTPWMAAVYAGAGVTVTALTAMRVVAASRQSSARPNDRPTQPLTESSPMGSGPTIAVSGRASSK